MIVYVESNFVLELAFLQEEHESCLELLSLSESGDICLMLPAFSIGEPYEAWVRRSKQRRDLHEQLITAIHELSRSRPYQGSSDEFQELTNLLRRSGEEEKLRLDNTLERILQTVEVIPIGLSIIRAAITFQKSLESFAARFDSLCIDSQSSSYRIRGAIAVSLPRTPKILRIQILKTN